MAKSLVIENDGVKGHKTAAERPETVVVVVDIKAFTMPFREPGFGTCVSFSKTGQIFYPVAAFERVARAVHTACQRLFWDQTSQTLGPIFVISGNVSMCACVRACVFMCVYVCV